MSQQLEHAVGFGAAALDIYPEFGVVGPNHNPSTKLTLEHDAFMAYAAGFLSGERKHERRIGGNVLNVLAYMACRRAVNGEVRFASVLGTEGDADPASAAIITHMAELGITDRVLRVPGYLPTISIIERLEPGSDRMVRARPRDSLVPHLPAEHMRYTSSDASVIVISSLKDAGLARCVFENTPAGAFRSYNPGSSEFKRQSPELLDIIRTHQPNLFALNDEEATRLYFREYIPDVAEPSDADILRLRDELGQDGMRRIAARLSRFAGHVLCTLGKDGVLLASNGDTLYQPAEFVDPGRVVDTLGAGDRAHAAALHALCTGLPGETVLAEVVNSTAQVIQYLGAHGDLVPAASARRR